jgi:O-methyltransferase
MNLIKKLFHLKSNEHHFVLNYFGRSSHKQVDIRKIEVFGPIAKEIIETGKTYLYYDRLFTIYNALINLHRILPVNEKLFLLEAGVYKGGGSYFMASILKQLGINNYHLFSVDTFEGHSALDLKDNTLDGTQKPGEFNETSFESVQSYLSKFTNVTVCKGRIQDVAMGIEDHKFGLVHLDMDIYHPTLFSLNFFNDKLIKGGIIILDDYGFVSCPGVKTAVDDFLISNPCYNLIPLLSGQCLLIKY